MIKMKLLKMDRVKAVWNKYAANKIPVTIIKFWRAMIETKIYLINFENKLIKMPLEITWEIQEKVLFPVREGKCLQGICFEFAKEN